MEREKVLVAGLGRSGFAAAAMLSHFAQVCCWDSKQESSFDKDEIQALKVRGVSFVFGEAPSAAGFAKLVLSPGIPLGTALAEEARALGIPVSGELEEAYAHCRGTFYAVTGTNGKTTTTALIGEIFKADGRDTRVVGNIGLPASAEALSAGPDTCMVTEVSSFQLETADSFRPRISAILNITPDHLDRHGSFEEYARIKGRIFANQGEGDWCVYNADDPETAKLAAACRRAGLAAFSRKFRPKPPCAYVSGGKLYADIGQGPEFITEAADIGIPGAHNLENALAAAAVCRLAGTDCGVIARTLKAFKGVEHRIEFVREYEGVRYINDSKGTNPDASAKAVEAVKAPIILIAGGYEKNSDFTEFIDGFAGKVEYLLLLGATAARFRDAALSCGFAASRIYMCEDMKEAVEKGHSLARPGYTVLLSPASASWGMYANFEERGEDFKRLVLALGG